MSITGTANREDRRQVLFARRRSGAGRNRIRTKRKPASLQKAWNRRQSDAGKHKNLLRSSLKEQRRLILLLLAAIQLTLLQAVWARPVQTPPFDIVARTVKPPRGTPLPAKVSMLDGWGG